MQMIKERTAETADSVIGAEVRAWLGRRGVSQKWLAEQLGIVPMGISRRLSGKTSFTARELLLAAQALDVTLGELLGSALVNEKNPHLLDADGGPGNRGSAD